MQPYRCYLLDSAKAIRQALLQEVRERTDKGFRPDWINLPEESARPIFGTD
jgi:hypothetical protein